MVKNKAKITSRITHTVVNGAVEAKSIASAVEIMKIGF